MKQQVNNFAVTGFVAKDAEIKGFENSSVARFAVAINHSEKVGDETKRTSAFINIEAWRKNEKTSDFDVLKKGALVTIEGYFKPEEWTDNDEKKHNRIAFVARKMYLAPEKEEKTKK